MSAAADRDAIEVALRSAGIDSSIKSLGDLSGGCIHRVLDVELADGRHVIAKISGAAAAAMFEEEAISLSWLAHSGTVLTPTVLATATHERTAVLLMSRIDRPTSLIDRTEMWRTFGRDLAALHRAALPSALALGYGFVADNHIGSTPQPNAWGDDWVEFNAEHRLGSQARHAQSRGLLARDEVARIDAVIARLDRLLPRTPRPALLHGDLWSGNALPAARGPEATCAVIDPACYIGDALADIAMMRLFGGFDQACFDAWSEHAGIDLRSVESASAIAVYQLYHVLNHVNIFGRGYVAQAMDLARRLT